MLSAHFIRIDWFKQIGSFFNRETRIKKRFLINNLNVDKDHEWMEEHANMSHVHILTSSHILYIFMLVDSIVSNHLSVSILVTFKMIWSYLKSTFLSIVSLFTTNAAGNIYTGRTWNIMLFVYCHRRRQHKMIQWCFPLVHICHRGFPPYKYAYEFVLYFSYISFSIFWIVSSTNEFDESYLVLQLSFVEFPIAQKVSLCIANFTI